MHRSSRPTVMDFFCGAGGLSEGFRQAGFEVLLGVDCDPSSVKTFQRHHGRAVECRIEDITPARIRKEIGNRKITVLTAGPPCQAFSTVATAKLRSLGRSTTTRHPLNQLYKQFLYMVKRLEPSFFVMENVGRMFSISNGSIKREIERELRGKYNVNFYYENVADFGVPQMRRRGVVIGNRLGLSNPELVHTHFDPVKKSSGRKKKYQTVRDAISDLPIIRAGSGNEVMQYTGKSRTPYQKKRRKGLKKVYNHTARDHNDRDMKIFKKLRPGQWIADLPKSYNPYRKDIFKDKIKRQPWTRPSSTILAHLSKDGLMFVHPGQNRSLTPREAARLQSFDDNYIFEGPRTQQFIQIGNAVPPLFAKHIALSIMDAMAVKSHRSSRKFHRRNHR